jgi:hypothetical protein
VEVKKDAAVIVHSESAGLPARAGSMQKRR